MTTQQEQPTSPRRFSLAINQEDANSLVDPPLLDLKSTDISSIRTHSELSKFIGPHFIRLTTEKYQSLGTSLNTSEVEKSVKQIVDTSPDLRREGIARENYEELVSVIVRHAVQKINETLFQDPENGKLIVYREALECTRERNNNLVGTVAFRVVHNKEDFEHTLMVIECKTPRELKVDETAATCQILAAMYIAKKLNDYSAIDICIHSHGLEDEYSGEELYQIAKVLAQEDPATVRIPIFGILTSFFTTQFFELNYSEMEYEREGFIESDAAALFTSITGRLRLSSELILDVINGEL